MPDPMTSIIIYDGQTTAGRIKVTFNLGFIFYHSWLVTFTKLKDRREIYQCTCGWLSYAHRGQWDTNSGWSPTAANWIPQDALQLVEDWLRRLPDDLMPRIEDFLRDQPIAGRKPTSND